ncbi:HlyD family efflux transporter periplasmic adaptor subunit [Marinobacterium sediminicola]|uniref:HlyD family efflux transporter periplasmic adaptor subunit n=1 Tax=Marinobacterium sediminicola TaxID=518898 RepID=UPI001EEF7BEA|nr:HlyD family efflux transporter periplasmic adaptor subunit [Marinobacterium sediminicola]ULG68280.1 HlyD family efflux transporter periplasmic adaptor subunit [Marinobacterium sediminicola]
MKSSSDTPNPEKYMHWFRLLHEESDPVFFSAWFNLLNDGLGGIQEGVLVLGPANTGPFEPKASWPYKTPCSAALMAAAEQAMELCRPVMQRAGAHLLFAMPVVHNNDLLGVLAISPNSPGLSIQQKNWIQWGLGWLLGHGSVQAGASDGELNERLILLLELLMSSLDSDDLEQAVQTVLSQASVSLNCDRIALGFAHRQGVKLFSLANVAEFSRKIDLVQDLEAAMVEAVDQGEAVAWPGDQDSLVIRDAHRALAERQGNHTLLSIPFIRDREQYGVLTFEWAEEPETDNIELATAVAPILGQVLLKGRNQDHGWLDHTRRLLATPFKRVFGAGYLGTKMLAMGALALVLFFSLAEGEFRIDSDARLEGALNRSLAAPFDAYLEQAILRAGQVVKAGDLLAKLDDRDMRLELAKLESQEAQYTRQLQLAQASWDSAQAGVISAQLAQVQAQLTLVRTMLQRTEIRAPFDALITSGDLSQDLGLPISKGQVLFELAPLADYRLVLDVPEADIGYLQVGQRGELVLKAFPDQPAHFEVSLITPLAEARDGQNLFRVEAQLDAFTEGMRPGLEGVGKVSVDERKLIWIWTRELRHWLSLSLWKWFGV